MGGGDTAAERILRESRNPLIFGLSRSSTQGQRAAVRLAEELRGNIDTTASVCHGPSIMAIQQVGESTSSLGEIRNRADLVIFWGANPVESHPRHFERYSVDPIGQFVPRGRKDRTVVVVDTKPTATSVCADLFLQVKPQRDFEVFWTLRQLIRGESLAGGSIGPTGTGVSADALRDLAHRMTSCRYGVAFFGLGLAQRGLGHLTVAALLRLVAELNDHTRFVARRLRLPGDVTGADSVLCWQTGFPFAVNLARGYPRYNPGEFTADELLTRGETDACLLVGSESVELLSAPARAALREIPTIVLDYPHIEPPWQPTVRFTTAVYGVHLPGTAYRMDETPIPMRRIMCSEYASDDDVLTALLERLTRLTD
jgi:formylmethanofuran dehydrogenase subunit B